MFYCWQNNCQRKETHVACFRLFLIKYSCILSLTTWFTRWFFISCYKIWSSTQFIWFWVLTYNTVYPKEEVRMGTSEGSTVLQHVAKWLTESCHIVSSHCLFGWSLKSWCGNLARFKRDTNCWHALLHPRNRNIYVDNIDFQTAWPPKARTNGSPPKCLSVRPLRNRVFSCLIASLLIL